MIFDQRQQSRAQQQHNPAQLQKKKKQKSDIFIHLKKKVWTTNIYS